MSTAEGELAAVLQALDTLLAAAGPASANAQYDASRVLAGAVDSESWWSIAEGILGAPAESLCIQARVWACGMVRTKLQRDHNVVLDNEVIRQIFAFLEAYYQAGDVCIQVTRSLLEVVVLIAHHAKMEDPFAIFQAVMFPSSDLERSVFELLPVELIVLYTRAVFDFGPGNSGGSLPPKWFAKACQALCTVADRQKANVDVMAKVFECLGTISDVATVDNDVDVACLQRLSSELLRTIGEDHSALSSLISIWNIPVSKQHRTTKWNVSLEQTVDWICNTVHTASATCSGDAVDWSFLMKAMLGFASLLEDMQSGRRGRELAMNYLGVMLSVWSKCATKLDIDAHTDMLCFWSDFFDTSIQSFSFDSEERNSLLSALLPNLLFACSALPFSFFTMGSMVSKYEHAVMSRIAEAWEPCAETSIAQCVIGLTGEQYRDVFASECSDEELPTGIDRFLEELVGVVRQICCLCPDAYWMYIEHGAALFLGVIQGNKPSVRLMFSMYRFLYLGLQTFAPQSNELYQLYWTLWRTERQIFRADPKSPVRLLVLSLLSIPVFYDDQPMTSLTGSDSSSLLCEVINSLQQDVVDSQSGSDILVPLSLLSVCSLAFRVLRTHGLSSDLKSNIQGVCDQMQSSALLRGTCVYPSYLALHELFRLRTYLNASDLCLRAYVQPYVGRRDLVCAAIAMRVSSLIQAPVFRETDASGTGGRMVLECCEVLASTLFGESVHDTSETPFHTLVVFISILLFELRAGADSDLQDQLSSSLLPILSGIASHETIVSSQWARLMSLAPPGLGMHLFSTALSDVRVQMEKGSVDSPMSWIVSVFKVCPAGWKKAPDGRRFWEDEHALKEVVGCISQWMVWRANRPVESVALLDAVSEVVLFWVPQLWQGESFLGLFQGLQVIVQSLYSGPLHTRTTGERCHRLLYDVCSTALKCGGPANNALLEYAQSIGLPIRSLPTKQAFIGMLSKGK